MRGYITQPELRYTPKGNPVCNFRLLATFMGREDWIPIVCIKKIAEIANDQLKKGDVAFVDGILTTRKFTDGKGQERKIFEIVANEVWLAGVKRQSKEQAHDESATDTPSIPDDGPSHESDNFSTLDD
ncbi:MAG: single-stranded DNA-binding protein [Burkholderia sp.]